MKKKKLMRNKLELDNNVDSKWKSINRFLYWGFLVLMVVRVFVQLKDRYNVEQSKLGNMLLILALIVFLSWGLINIFYKFKPTWFYKKEVE